MVKSLFILAVFVLMSMPTAFGQLGPDDTHIGTPSPKQVYPFPTPEPEEPLPPAAEIMPFQTEPDPVPYPWPHPRPDHPSDEGDPLVFNIDGNEACTIKAYPEEMHPSRIMTFDLLANGEQLTLSRILCDSTMTLFIDFNDNGVMDNGQEWGFGETIIYENLKILDSNDNGYFDYVDDYWDKAMIKQDDNDFKIKDTGILGFDYSNAVNVFNDMHGNGRYADCLYDGVKFYPTCHPVSTQSGFRIMAYNENGVITTNGVFPSYGAVIGYLQ